MNANTASTRDPIEQLCYPRYFWAVTVYAHRGISPMVLTLCATRAFAERVQRMARSLGMIEPEIVFIPETDIHIQSNFSNKGDRHDR